MANRWVLPEGIEELLPTDAKRVESMRRGLLNLYASWGYQLVIPSFVEFSESLLLDENPDLDLKTFKIIDRVSGKTMGLRADMTPQIARIDACALHTEGVNRLCYAGSVLHTMAKDPLASRSPIQIGCEVYGNASLSADIEVISLMLSTLHIAGVTNITLDLGHVQILDTILAEMNLTSEDEARLMGVLKRKALNELTVLLDELCVSDISKQQLTAVAKIQGGLTVLPILRRELAGANEAIQIALDDLESIMSVICNRYQDVNIFIDLTELRGFRYHNGLVFAALSPNVGEPLATGGRYDEISERYGRSRPATGFSSDLKALLKFGASDTAQEDAIFISPALVDVAWDFITKLRSEGRIVLEGQSDVCSASEALRCTQQILIRDGECYLAPVEI